ncbi:MAG TPA: conjugal transfer protein, partial [Solirubrobacteraceae bacterium]
MRRSEQQGVPAVRTPSTLLRTLGRVALWSVVALLLLRGANDVLAGEAPAPVTRETRAGVVSWPDDEARAFAVDFTRAYLSYSPRYPQRYARGVLAFVSPDVADSVVPRFAQRHSRQVVQNALVARVERQDDRHALVTVAATLASRSVSTRYLTVPVARDSRGGLTVYDLPSFAAPPARAQVRLPEPEPLSGVERAEIEDVLT